MAARREFDAENPTTRPRSLTPPPPDSAEALYYEGMAAYQHRNWEQALERFTRLKELQPARPGLDALLDEVRWFLQLQAAAPVAVDTPLASGLDTAVTNERQRPGTGRWQIVSLVALAAIGITALLLFAFQDRLPWARASDREAQEVFNRGQARLAAGDYEGAEAAFTLLLEMWPGNPEAQLALDTARRQKALAQGYAAAEAAIAEEDWDKAAAELDSLLATAPGYADAQARADYVAQQRRLAELYDDGSRLYDLTQWEAAIAQFEKIRELDSTYRPEAVAEFLFVCYLNAGEAAVVEAGGDLATVTRAVEYFSRALAIHPRNRLASDARRLGGLYLDALRALAEGNRAEGQSRLEALLIEAPAYGEGEAANQLYQLLLADAESALQAGNIPAAIQLYAQAQTVPGVDVSAASRGEALARAITPTPTPRPTATVTPTPIPLPVVVVDQGPLNVRAGPGVSYAVIGQAAAGARLQVTGRSADGAWLRVCNADERGICQQPPGQQGWLAARLLVIQGDLNAVAVATPAVAPPTATAPVAPRPTATAASLVACITGQVRDVAGGQPLAGWTVTAQGPAGQALTARTDANGSYLFANLSPGAYTVSQRVEVEWRSVSPVSGTVTVVPAAACVVVDFWNGRSESGSAPEPEPQPQPTPSPTRPR